jgi:hypothetical protein
MVAKYLQKIIIQLRDLVQLKGLLFMQLMTGGDTMAHDSDRRINTDAKIENDGVKRQPHERDESPDGQDQRPSGIMKQAAADLAQGLVDTDLRNTPGLDQAVDPAAGATGQATPQPDREDGMRERNLPQPTPRGKQ